MRSTSDDLLLLLKTRGPGQTLALAERLGVTRQAARQHLERLGDEGLVGYVETRAGVGRPRRVWSLTPQGHARFPDTHAQMTVELLDAVREEFGADGLERLVSRRERATAGAYAEALAGAESVEARLECLAAARTAEGYMADWRAEPDGTWLLVENHCPICAAAAACQGFCRSELSLFQALLAPATVVRVEHLLDGARRCAYRIGSATSSAARSGSAA